MHENNVKKLTELVLREYRSCRYQDVFTAAISGIDASGKGFVSNSLQNELEKQDLKIANINIDPWQNPISLRLQMENPAENFYEKVFWWDDFFTELITPLKKNGSIYLETMLIRTDADEYYPHVYNFNDVNILLVEGIFLFMRGLLNYYDSKIWIDCSFKTGLQRAIARNSENLSEGQLVHDYSTYYYPAQHYHFQHDNPQKSSDIIYCNDELLGTVGQLTVNSLGEV
jgi:uridine kinase